MTPRLDTFRSKLALLALASLACGQIVPQAARAEDEAALVHAKALSRAFRKAAEATVPTVVKITTHSKPQAAQGRGGRRPNPFRGTPFEELFPDDMQRRLEQSPNQREGVGSGVIIDSAGIVLTNNHVVEGADSVKVHLNDGREFDTTDIKFDKETDLAVLRLVDAKNLPAARIGDSDKLDVGDWVIAVGNPFELETTVSAGIISAKGRSIGVRRGQFLQTDAAINPGNSGGPLVNLDGEVVGINTAIASNSGGYQGIGFAIPINKATWVTNQLVKAGKVQRAYLGVSIAKVTNERAEKLELRRGEGVLVAQVYPDTPAAEAGLKEDDVVIRFAGQPVAGPSELQELVERCPLESRQKMQLLRDGKPLTLDIAMKALPEGFGVAARGAAAPPLDVPEGKGIANSRLGFEISELSKDMAERFSYTNLKGVLVSKVDEEGLAFDRGLRVGMLIMKVGKRSVATVEEYQAAMKEESLREGVLLFVRSGSSNRFIVIDDQR